MTVRAAAADDCKTAAAGAALPQRDAPAGGATEATLRRQQQDFAAAVRGAPVRRSLLRPRPDGRPAAVGAYRHAHSARLAAALRDNFEMLARAMGDPAFDALAAAYVAARPSTTASIRWFGDGLACFMTDLLAAGDERVAHGALVDFARMDWALRSAFDAADAPVLQPAALAAQVPASWPALRLALRPSVRRVALQWAIEPTWRVLHAAEPGFEPELPAPEPLAHALLVWRQRGETRWRALNDDEAALLQAVDDGLDFAALCDIAAGQAGDAGQAAPRVVAALQQWLAHELLRG